MNEDILYQHGIKGQKWGVIRTPQQLGHYQQSKPQVSGKKSESQDSSQHKESNANKFWKTIRRSSSLSDEELQKRINRLNMEERYADLVARQKARNSSSIKPVIKKLLGGAAEDFGRQLLGKGVSKLIDKIAGDKKIDIEKYKGMDINEMDPEVISKVSKWYGDALKIRTSRDFLSKERT